MSQSKCDNVSLVLYRASLWTSSLWIFLPPMTRFPRRTCNIPNIQEAGSGVYNDIHRTIIHNDPELALLSQHIMAEKAPHTWTICEGPNFLRRPHLLACLIEAALLSVEGSYALGGGCNSCVVPPDVSDANDAALKSLSLVLPPPYLQTSCGSCC